MVSVECPSSIRPKGWLELLECVEHEGELEIFGDSDFYVLFSWSTHLSEADGSRWVSCLGVSDDDDGDDEHPPRTLFREFIAAHELDAYLENIMTTCRINGVYEEVSEDSLCTLEGKDLEAISSIRSRIASSFLQHKSD